MVREQEPARASAAPARSIASETAGQKERVVIEITSSPVTSSNMAHLASPQPVFGRPTELGSIASPLGQERNRQQQPQKIVRRSADRAKDSYGNLFAGAKANVPKPYHPRSEASAYKDFQSSSINGHGSGGREHDIYGQPLRGQHTNPQPTQSKNSATISVPSVPRQIWQPAPRPTFSTASARDPFYMPSSSFTNMIRTTKPASVDEDEFNDQKVFGSDRFGTADPYLYVDSSKAADDIKALLEGAMDEEDARPRTRRKKREAENKVDSLTQKMSRTAIANKDAAANDVDDAEGEEEVEDDGTRPGLMVKLLPHQIEGVEWMMNKELATKKVKGILPKGGILADDMGLGKTIQSIALILGNPRPTDEALQNSKRSLDSEVGRTTLVVAPLALIRQWEAEIANRVAKSHTLNVKVHHGPSRTKSYKDLQKYDVVITTYQTLTSEHNEGSDILKTALFGVHWYRVILDEAHSIKSRNAKATKAAYALNAEYRWCLTGTPMQNNLDELQSLIHFLRIKPYDALEMWREQIMKPLQSGRGGLSIRRLRAFLSAFMKRRTKDVLKLNDRAAGQDGAGSKPNSAGFKIVKRDVINVKADLSPRERAFYQRLEDRTDKSLQVMMAGGQVSYASALVLLLRLRQACNHPQLLGADLSKEQAALDGTRTPGRKGSKGDEMDDIADLLGGLNVQAKKCEICQIDLSKQDLDEASGRCVDCEEEMKAIDVSFSRKPKPKHKKRSTPSTKPKKNQHRSTRRVVVDSDDEGDEDDNHDHDTSATTAASEEASSDGELESASSNSNSDSDSYSQTKPGKINPIVSTKIRHLLKILRHDCETHKYIVFSFFTSMLDLIEPFLDRHNLRYVRYDGSMRNDLREASLESLRNNDRIRIMLCSLKAGSLGLNLTCASRVVILEPFWNPFVEEQAIDRVHRLNQTQDVVVHKITIADSVEERILGLQERKRELANATLEGGKAMGAGKLSMTDMLNLFRHDAEGDAKLDRIGMKERGSVLNRSEGTASSGGWGISDVKTYSSQEHDSREMGAGGRKGGRDTGGSKRAEDPVWGRR